MTMMTTSTPRRNLAWAVAGALTLGACAGMPAAPVHAPPAPAPAAPQPVAGYDWHLPDTTDLVYGAANSDDVAISLSCRPGGGRIEVVRDAPAPSPAETYLESGGDTERLSAEVEESGLTGGYFLTSAIAADAPVMQRFRDLGWLAVWDQGERKTYVAHPESRDRVTRFFAACG